MTTDTENITQTIARTNRLIAKWWAHFERAVDAADARWPLSDAASERLDLFCIRTKGRIARLQEQLHEAEMLAHYLQVQDSKDVWNRRWCYAYEIGERP